MCLHASMRAIFGDGNFRKELTDYSWHLGEGLKLQNTVQQQNFLLEQKLDLTLTCIVFTRLFGINASSNRRL